MVNTGSDLDVERLVWHDMQIARNGLDLSDGAVHDRKVREAYELLLSGVVAKDIQWQGVLPQAFVDWPDQARLYIRDFVHMSQPGIVGWFWRKWIGTSVWFKQIIDC